VRATDRTGRGIAGGYGRDDDSFLAGAGLHSRKPSKGLHQVQSIRFPGADTAIVISKGGIQFAGQTGIAAETRSVDTWVLARQDGTWRVEAFHNCAQDPA
jgi:uncharacterized protein (TIGR02246 family)